jgi:hypothetical protein
MKKIILMLFVSLNLFCGAAFACGCPGQLPDASDESIAQSIAKEVKDATIVFSGKVVSAQFVPIVENHNGVKIKAEALIYKFAVESSWKGDNKDEIIFPTSVRRYSDGTGSIGSNCVHSSFKVGEKYLVYAVGSMDKLKALVCGRTKLIQKAERDVKELLRLRKEQANVENTTM